MTHTGARNVRSTGYQNAQGSNWDFQSIRKVYRMEDVLGLETNASKIVCPLPDHVHANNTPSFVIFWEDGVQKFQCFGNCGHGGDVIDLIGFLSIPGFDVENPGMIQEAANILIDGYSINLSEPIISSGGLNQKSMDDYPLGEEVIQYGKTRGLTEATLRRFRVGQKENFMAIPTFEDQLLTMVKFRNITDVGNRFHNLKGSRKSLFNYDMVYLTRLPILIVKGEIPAMLLCQYGIVACAPNSGENSTLNEHYKVILSLAEKRIVVGDNDKDPDVAKVTRQAAVDRAKFLDAELKFPPTRYKDIDDWILDDWAAITEIRNWL